MRKKLHTTEEETKSIAISNKAKESNYIGSLMQ